MDSLVDDSSSIQVTSFTMQASIPCVPHTDSEIKRGRDNEVFPWMEGSTHNIVSVTSQHGNTLSTLPVPDPDGLVIRRRENPGVLLMKLASTDIVHVGMLREDTPP